MTDIDSIEESQTHSEDGTCETTLSRAERGAAMVEYALLITFIAIVAVTALSLLGGTVSAEFSTINSGFN